MRCCLIALIVSTSLGAITVAQDDISTIVTEVKSLKLKYWKDTHNETLSRWNVEFSREEILALQWLVKRATPLDADKAVLFINAFEGELLTANNAFTIRIGEQKLVGRPVIFELRDKTKPQTRQIYQLTGDNAEEFMLMLRWALESKIRDIKPDEIRNRNK